MDRLVTISRQCARLLRHAEGIPERKKWIEERNEWRTQLQSAFDSDQFARVTELGETLHQHYLRSSQLLLCERHYCSFPARCAQLLVELNGLCRTLTDCKNYALLNVAVKLRDDLLQLNVDEDEVSGQQIIPFHVLFLHCFFKC